MTLKKWTDKGKNVSWQIMADFLLVEALNKYALIYETFFYRLTLM